MHEAFVSVHKTKNIFHMSYVHTTQHHFNLESERFAYINMICQLNKVSFRNSFLKMRV